MPRRIVFHIGLAKTGTTSLQLFCHRHRRALRRRGLLYPASQLGWARNHSPLVASYIAHRPEDRSVAFRWSPRREAVAALRAEIDASPCATALVSSEHFSTHFDRSEALELFEDFAAYDPIVVLALRDTHGRFLSAYATHVTAGGRLTPDEYARTVLVPGTRFMSLRETVLIWREAFGADRMRLVDFDAEPEIVPAILRHGGIEADPPSTASPRRRVSLGPAETEALRRANAAIVARQAVPATESLGAWAQLSLLSYLCRKRLARLDRGATRERWNVGAQTMAALDAVAGADRAWLADEHGLVLRGSPARARMQVEGAPVEATGTGTRDPAATPDGHALVAAASRGLWAPSVGLVGLWDLFAAPKSR